MIPINLTSRGSHFGGGQRRSVLMQFGEIQNMRLSVCSISRLDVAGQTCLDILWTRPRGQPIAGSAAGGVESCQGSKFALNRSVEVVGRGNHRGRLTRRG